MTTRVGVISQARAWVGKNESDGSFKEIIDTYNTIAPLPVGYAMKYSDEWCAAFVSAVAQKCNATDIIFPECGCRRMVDLFKAANCWQENDAYTPAPGDLIFYDWSDTGIGDDTNSPDHVGIVESVVGVLITVIEGNNNEAVRRRTIPVNGKFIRGYAIPKYDEPAPAAQKSNEDIAREVIAGKWGVNPERANRIQAAGYNYDAIQSIVNSMLSVPTPEPQKKSDEDIAHEVIAGKWGVGSDRVNRIQAAGYNFDAVQAIVNRLMA